jgi:hypothetical protein
MTILQFKSPEQAAQNLQALSQGYANERDAIMRQQLFFDIPMIALGAAAIVNPIFRGATNTTIALGLGAAGAAGLRTYFGPQGKVTAYDNAAGSLSCASGVAQGLSDDFKKVDTDYKQEMTNLGVALGQASSLILSGTVPATLAAALLVARDQAQKALGDLVTAVNVVSTSPLHLQIFANAVINGTNKKIISGEQNVDAALAVIRTAPTSVTPATTVTPPGPKPKPNPTFGAESAPTPSDEAIDLITKLQAQASEAENNANRINAIWATLATCAGPA